MALSLEGLPPCTPARQAGRTGLKHLDPLRGGLHDFLARRGITHNSTAKAS